jgi:hypothetical protein
MLTNSEGGFSHTELYNMPVSMRTFYYRLLVKRIKDREKRMEEMRKQSKNTKNPKLPNMRRK